MKKRLFIIIILMVVACGNLCAGSFYVNITILSTTGAKVFELISKMGLAAFVFIRKGTDSVVLCEEGIDKQDEDFGKRLTSEISKQLKTIAIYKLNHDSDILILEAFKDGEHLFSFNSDPGYFDGAEVPALLNGLSEFLEYFPNAKMSELENILKSDYDDADELDHAIVRYLDLPNFSVGFSYDSVSTCSDSTALAKDNNIEIYQPKQRKKNAGFSCLVEKYVAPELAQNDFLMKKIENDFYLFYRATNTAERILLMKDGMGGISCALRRKPDPGVRIYLTNIPLLVKLFGTDEEKILFRLSVQTLYYTTEEELLGALELCVDMIKRYSTDFYAGAYDELLFTDMENYKNLRDKQVAEIGEQAVIDQGMEEMDLWKKQRFSGKRWSL